MNRGSFSFVGPTLISASPTTGLELALLFSCPPVLVFLNNRSLLVPLTASIYYEGAVLLIPLLISLGIAARVGTGVGVFATLISYYQDK